ncbi:NAD(P)H-dependent flavin oxidoreductase [Alicyclobacillus sp. ALC3]|uniref:NAD(P)H-dependent flavin oxidoreductase n=1 Tax=Alicyclobacillus sp. ALC3 TaxID=2796143 RepID=UPI002378B79C|nr:nitronate monooxygenase [Alicyclobacillus sp. ALC3]WDL99239.1 nitronate monooxygenase [Alicyclobacillus sp. ALC3]
MIHTPLTRDWGLRYPIIGAPMAGAADGRLAAAVSSAGGLGMIGIGSQASNGFIHEQAAVARQGGKFGLGLMVWALADRPELLEAAVAARPNLLSLSFGDPTPYVPVCHAAGIPVAVQVHSQAEARQAERAGVDLIVAQGTEAGGHTGAVATLPLLQVVLDTVSVPVVAAGGIATPQGLAAVLAAGAAGAWIGTALLASPEAAHNATAQARLLAADETETLLTHVFDCVQGLAWPEEYPGRALRNDFAARWHGQEETLMRSEQAIEEFHQGRGDYSVGFIYAGQSVGLVRQVRPAADVISTLGEAAEQWLSRRLTILSGQD